MTVRFIVKYKDLLPRSLIRRLISCIYDTYIGMWIYSLNSFKHTIIIVCWIILDLMFNWGRLIICCVFSSRRRWCCPRLARSWTRVRCGRRCWSTSPPSTRRRGWAPCCGGARARLISCTSMWREFWNFILFFISSLVTKLLRAFKHCSSMWRESLGMKQLGMREKCWR